MDHEEAESYVLKATALEMLPTIEAHINLPAVQQNLLQQIQNLIAAQGVALANAIAAQGVVQANAIAAQGNAIAAQGVAQANAIANLRILIRNSSLAAVNNGRMETDELQMLLNDQGVQPTAPQFVIPYSKAEIRRFLGLQVSALLNFYGIAPAHTVAERKDQLIDHLQHV
jgi:hypothetical protein